MTIPVGTYCNVLKKKERRKRVKRNRDPFVSLSVSENMERSQTVKLMSVLVKVDDEYDSKPII